MWAQGKLLSCTNSHLLLGSVWCHMTCWMSPDAGFARRRSTEGETGHGRAGGCGPGAIQGQLQSEIRQNQDKAFVSRNLYVQMWV